MIFEQHDIPAVLDRYEAKFTIPAFMIEPISEFASVYCEPDKHSEKTGDLFYRVNNLYFDTPNYLFLKKRLEGAEDRFNMRVRSYGDDPGPPFFLEVKQKKSNVVRKFRAKVHDDWLHDIYQEDGTEQVDTLAGEEDNNRKLFSRLSYAYRAAPRVLTQYRRKAYVSIVDEYARVTFDTDLRYREETGYSLIPDEEKMVPSDDETIFDPGCGVILELKCYCSRVPLWMIDLIRHFDLKRRSFSKYVTGVMNVLNLFTYGRSDRNGI